MIASSQQAQMSADLRDIITMDSSAIVNLIFNGRPIQGTKGDLLNTAHFDRDDGGINDQSDFTATFVFCDFPSKPQGDEIVMVDGVQKRILRASFDDFLVGVALSFVTQNQE